MSEPTLRVVLAPRAAIEAQRLLGEAAALARAMDAELAALFVEESALLRCVALPFSVEVGLASGAVRPTDPESTRRMLARTADQLRTLLAETAAGLGLEWSFAVTRGDLLREALSAAAAAPVLLEPPHSARQYAAWPQAGRSGVTVAVLEEPTLTAITPAEPTRLVKPARAAADRAWAAAVRFAGGRTDAVARVRLEDLGSGPRPRVLVVPLASVTGRAGALEFLLASARCPVVLVA